MLKGFTDMKFAIFDFKKYSNDKKVVIWGVGAMLHVTAYCLEELQIPLYAYANVEGFSQALFYNVISLAELVDICEKEEIFILWGIEGNAREEIKILENAGIKQVYSVRNLWEYLDVKSISEVDDYVELYKRKNEIFFWEDTIANIDKVYMYSLDATVTERCSLKCKDCSNLMQYYTHPKNLDVTELKTAIDSILKKIECIFDLRILGGEPFMNLEFIKLVDAYKDEPKIKRISIFSNATIFPTEEILEQLKHSKVLMRMSDYGLLSKNLDKWVSWCIDNNIDYIVAKMEFWNDCGKLERHDYSQEELLDVYGNCDCRNLPTLLGNKLFNCPYAANAANLGALEYCEMEKDFIIIDEKITSFEIDSFLYNRDYLEACRYCNGRNIGRARIKPFIQTRQPLKYKRLIEKVVQENSDEISIDKEENTLLSVVVPVYNMDRYIERCLLSILLQTYENLEILIIDDGSTDGTLDICKRMQKKDTKQRIKIFEIEHKGVVAARNVGIENASGQYITFVDADDYLTEKRYENMLSAIGDCDLLSAGWMNFSEDINRYVPDFLFDRGQIKRWKAEGLIGEGIYEGEKLMTFWKYSFENPAYQLTSGVLWTKIFRTSIMKEIYREIDESIFFTEDVLFIQRYLLECKKIAVIKEYGYYYNFRVPSIKKRYPVDKMFANFQKIFDFQKRMFKGHIYEKMLIEGAERQFSYFVKNVVLENTCETPAGKGKQWYYPYYGRLKGKSIILYGAGGVGKAYYSHIVRDMECVLEAWVDKNAKYLKEMELLPVQEVECIRELEYDYIIVAVKEEKLYIQIKEELIKNEGVLEEKIIWNKTKEE